MKLKIEKFSVADTRVNEVSLETFVTTVRDLKVGESFLIKICQSNHRYALSVMQYALGRRFMTRKDAGGGVRIGRVN